jgi:dynein heavy chain, axonemal
VSDTLEEWVKCQSHWVYLQPVFDSPDIQKQLQAECKRFKGVDIKWRTIMQTVVAEPKIIEQASVEGRKENF